jgi:hypothetical protein
MVSTPPVGQPTPVEITPGDIVILNGGTAFTSAGSTQAFSIRASQVSKAAHTLMLYALLTGIPTTVTVNVQIADDAGNWTSMAVMNAATVQSYGALAMATNNAIALFGFVPGFRYRITLTTLSGGTSPTVLFKVGVS